MSDIVTNEFLRIVKVNVDLSPKIVRAYTIKCVLNQKFGGSFTSCLTAIKHGVFHASKSKTSCCQCVDRSKKYQKPYHEWIFSKLYETDISIKCKLKHPNCLCKYKVKPSAALDELDLPVLTVLLRLNGITHNDIDYLNNLRNELSHAYNTQRFRIDEYPRLWRKVENSILAIAHLVDKSMYDVVKGQLQDMQKYAFDKEAITFLHKKIEQTKEDINTGKEEVKQQLSDIANRQQQHLTEIHQVHEVVNEAIKTEAKMTTQLSDIASGQQQQTADIYQILALVKENSKVLEALKKEDTTKMDGTKELLRGVHKSPRYKKNFEPKLTGRTQATVSKQGINSRQRKDDLRNVKIEPTIFKESDEETSTTEEFSDTVSEPEVKKAKHESQDEVTKGSDGDVIFPYNVIDSKKVEKAVKLLDKQLKKVHEKIRKGQIFLRRLTTKKYRHSNNNRSCYHIKRLKTSSVIDQLKTKKKRIKNLLKTYEDFLRLEKTKTEAEEHESDTGNRLQRHNVLVLQVYGG